MLKRLNSCKGQATVEYVIIMTFFVIIALGTLALLYAYSEYNWRLINTVSVPVP